MPYDLGDTVGLGVSLKDSAGALANASAVVLTITLPDGTTQTPSVTNPPASTGQYAYTYLPAVAGRHLARWTFTNPTAAYTDVMDVRPAAEDLLVSLADAKDHLDIPSTNTTDDEEIRTHIEAATAYIENQAGPVIRRTYVDVIEPGWGMAWSTTDIMLTHRQVLSITSVVTTTGVTWDAGALATIDLDGQTGILRLAPGGVWPNVIYRVTYVAGRAIIPATLSMAARLLLSWSWQTQRGTLTTPLTGGESDAGLSPYGGMVPLRVDAYLRPERNLAGFG